MTKQSQPQFTQDCGNNEWDKAIVEAEHQIAVAEARITGLRLSIVTFKELKATGEPFPGEQAINRKIKAA